MQLFIEAYPWDLVGEGVDDLLSRLRGEVGASGICIWAAAKPTSVLRARACETRVFRSRGGLYFQPRRYYYDRTRCRPLVSSWSHSGERFARAIDACRRNALDVRFIVSASRAGRLAEHYPEFATRNAYGAESAQSLCLSNSDVRAYLAGVASDLTAQFQSSAVMVTDFTNTWQEAYDPRLDGTQRLGEAERQLLGTCFCQSCCSRAEAAGINANDVIREVQEMINARLNGGCTDAERGPTSGADLHGYLQLQHEHLALLAEEMDEACATRLVIELAGDCAPALRDRGLGLAAYARRGQDMSEGAAGAVELRVPAWLAMDTRAPDFVSSVHAAAVRGCVAISIDHLGLLPDASLPALKQALRFARRSVEDAVAAG